MIIECHGHYRTAPAAVGSWRESQVASVSADPAFVGAKGEIDVSDDEIRESISEAQLRQWSREA